MESGSTPGQLILASRTPRQFAEALRLSELRAISLSDAERETCGASEGEVGAYLLGLWGMPLEITQAIAKQETPLAIDREQPGLATLLYVCKRLSRDPDAPLSEEPSCGDGALYAYYLEQVGALDSLPKWRETARRTAA